MPTVAKIKHPEIQKCFEGAHKDELCLCSTCKTMHVQNRIRTIYDHCKPRGCFGKHDWKIYLYECAGPVIDCPKYEKWEPNESDESNENTEI